MLAKFKIGLFLLYMKQNFSKKLTFLLIFVTIFKNERIFYIVFICHNHKYPLLIRKSNFTKYLYESKCLFSIKGYFRQLEPVI